MLIIKLELREKTSGKLHSAFGIDITNIKLCYLVCQTLWRYFKYILIMR